MRDPAEMNGERDLMLYTLDQVASALPGDRWVAGQRVFYLVQSGQGERALAATATCRASAGWCQLLEGYVLQRAGRTREAAEVFIRTLATMDPRSVCELTDLASLIAENEVAANDARPCGSTERTAFETRLWWLADPSWLVDGNDRWVEHVARHVDGRIQADWGGVAAAVAASRAPFFSTGGDALVRGGRHDSYIVAQLVGPTYTPTKSGNGYIQSIVGKMRKCAVGEGFYFHGALAHPVSSDMVSPVTGSLVLSEEESPERRSETCARTASRTSWYHFIPSVSAALSPMTAAATSWDLHAGRSPGLAGIDSSFDWRRALVPPPERHTPRYVAAVRTLPGWQVAFFKRGDSAVLVTAFDTAPSTALESMPGVPRSVVGDSSTAAVFAFANFTPGVALPRDSFTLRMSGDARNRWIGSFTTPWDSLLLGLELLSEPLVAGAPKTGRGVLSRARFAAAPPRNASPIAVSDILVTEVRSTLPVALDGSDGAMVRALGTTDVTGRESIGLFWEIYGLTPGDSVDIALAVRGERITEGGGWFFGLFGGRSREIPASSARWRDQFVGQASGTPWPRSFDFSLRGLEPGRYELTLTVTKRGQPSASVVRAITIELPSTKGGQP
jgi:hypothetical protein